jgi:hypothetical protein
MKLNYISIRSTEFISGNLQSYNTKFFSKYLCLKYHIILDLY